MAVRTATRRPPCSWPLQLVGIQTAALPSKGPPLPPGLRLPLPVASPSLAEPAARLAARLTAPSPDPWGKPRNLSFWAPGGSPSPHSQRFVELSTQAAASGGTR